MLDVDNGPAFTAEDNGSRGGVKALASLVMALVALAPAPASAQSRLGSSCRPGQTAISGFLLWCDSGSRKFRYALPSDIPPTPAEGYTSRPPWYPALRDQLVADSAPACPVSGRVTLTSPVIDPQDLDLIIPQGELIFDHVTPIDHGYIGVRTLRLAAEARAMSDYVPIRTPADAQVLSIATVGSPTSLSITLAFGCDTYATLIVVNRVAGALGQYQDEVLSRGYVTPQRLRVLAGTIIGEQRDNPLDFMVEDGASWLSGYVAPFSYASEAWKPFVVNPWPYFSPDLQELYESRMQRTVEPRWGKIDLDVRWTAAGNWFLDGTVGSSGRPLSDFQGQTEITGGPVPGKNSSSWSHLAIVPHAVQPRRWMFSTGWWQNPAGDPVQLVIDLQPGQPTPAELTRDAGIVVYQLKNWMYSPNDTGPPSNAPRPINYDILPYFLKGIVVVQVNEDESITMEIIPSTNGALPTFTRFDGDSRVYRR